MLGGFVIGRWLGLLAFGIAVLRSIIIRRGRKLSGPHYCMLSFVGWSALSILWTVDWDSTAERVGTYLQLLTVVWLIWELAVTETRVLGLIQSYVLGTSVASVSTVVNLMLGRTAAQVRMSSGQTAMNASRYTITGFNENDLGLILALSIPMTFYLLAKRKGWLVTLLCWVQIVICSTSILLTGSRGALMAAGAAFLIFPLIVFRLPRWQKIASPIALAGVIACGVYLVPPITWDRLLGTGAEISEGTLTHRTVIWAAGISVLEDRPLLGVGAGAYGASVLKLLDTPFVAHNTYLSVLVELGVFGGLILFALLSGMLYSITYMEPLEKRLWIVVLFTWMVGASVLTWDYQKCTWLLFGMIAAHVYSRKPESSYAATRLTRAQPIQQPALSPFHLPSNQVTHVAEWD